MAGKDVRSPDQQKELVERLYYPHNVTLMKAALAGKGHSFGIGNRVYHNAGKEVCAIDTQEMSYPSANGREITDEVIYSGGEYCKIVVEAGMICQVLDHYPLPKHLQTQDSE